MGIKLVAIDIDATLLSSNHKILESTKQAVTKALAQGVKVVLCTGRPLAGVTPFLKELGISGDDQYVITFNGSIIETVSGKVLHKEGINRASYEAIDQYSKDHNVAYNVLDEDSKVYTSNRDVHVMTVIQAYENMDGVLIREPEEIPDVSMIKAVFCGDIPELDAQEPEIRKEFGDQFYIVRSVPYFLEVMHQGVDKGTALEKLAAQLDITADEVMVMGDEKNDLPMFAYAGTSVAMGNGTDEVKAVASFVTHSNDDDGIAYAFDKLVFKD